MSDKRPKKRSLTLKGHRTSVSLEDAFWRAFRQIAAEKSIPINVLAAKIDAERGVECGLASAIRLYVLDWAMGQQGSPPQRALDWDISTK